MPMLAGEEINTERQVLLEQTGLLLDRLKKKLSSDELEIVEKCAAQTSLDGFVLVLTKGALDAHTRLEKSRGHGVHRAADMLANGAVKLQHGLTRLSAFFKLADSVSGVPWVSVASETLAALLMIAVKKNDWEGKLLDLLENVDDYFPTYTALERLSKDEKAAKKLGQIQNRTIELMVQAMMYYSTNGYDIEKDARYIWKAALVASEQRILTLDQAVKTLGQTVETLEHHIRALKQTVKNSYLTKARGYLGGYLESTLFDLTPEYEARLKQADKKAFDGSHFSFQNDVVKREMGEEYKHWKTDFSSSVLILAGTSLHARDTGVSWLSPATFAIVREFSTTTSLETAAGEDDDAYVVVSATLHSAAYPPVHPSSATVLSYLLLKLIEQRSEVALDSKVQSLFDRPFDNKTLLDLWTVVLGHFTRVCLVIDRLDMCDGHYLSALKNLGAVVKAARAHCLVKVFVVFGDLYELRLEDFVTPELEGVFRVVRLDQRRLLN
ncbi:hypothetical protein B0H66DRAFT_613343 [Apodospora peruviana]|uniref:Uncharacterized protein n=1 Tax=Apodospora peruviana TaxID=516989 RepID=A0AAE0ITV3_9PEZI|nr:hypothetical protein B0H66DRAFT_613343 [Apodospora peruviana]